MLPGKKPSSHRQNEPHLLLIYKEGVDLRNLDKTGSKLNRLFGPDLQNVGGAPSKIAHSSLQTSRRSTLSNFSCS